MEKGGRRFWRDGLVLLVMAVRAWVVEVGMAADGVSRLERRTRAVSPCSGQRMRIAMDDSETASLMAVLDQLVRNV